MSLYLGCPIWTYKGWMGSFYPEGTKQSNFLREYARRLTTVEGNTTFYAVPNEEKLARWSMRRPKRSISALKPHVQSVTPVSLSHTSKKRTPLFRQ